MLVYRVTALAQRFGYRVAHWIERQLSSEGPGGIRIEGRQHRLGEHDKALHLNLTVQDVDEMIARLEQEQAQQLGATPRET